MRLNKNQKGFTLITWLVVFSIFVFMGIICIRLFTPFMQGYMVKKAVAQLAEEPALKTMSTAQLRKALQRRLYISNVKTVDAKNLQVDKQGSAIILNLDYEIRVHAVGNVDAVVKFSESVTVN